MGVAPSGTGPVRRVHFRAVTLIHQYAVSRRYRYTDEPDAHTRGLYFDPLNGVRECVMEASHPHIRDLYGMERKQQRRACESSGG
jgi:hypothetical protein